MSWTVPQFGLQGLGSPHQSPEPRMKILCAWCGAVIRDEGGTVRLDSHGICQGCATKAEAETNPTEAVQSDGEDREEIEPMT